MLGAVRNGNQLILYPRPDIDMIVNDLANKKPSFLPGVPTLYTAILKHPKAQGLDLKSLKICMWAARRCRSRCSRASRS
jgi:long-chain acyl-CoA synthetase